MFFKMSLKHLSSFKTYGIQNGGFLNSLQKCLQTFPRLFSEIKSKLDLKGIYPPITTPFDAKEDISFECLKSNLVQYQSIPFRGYVVFGSTGEFVSLQEKELLDVIKFVRKNVMRNKLIICGSGCQSTKSTIELTQKMADNGANAALIVSPSFYKGKMTDDALYTHYYKVAENSPIPIILYSVPANTNIDLSPALIIKLADHPNVIGLKDSGGDISKISYVIHRTNKKNFQVLAGSAGFLYPALAMGCVGGVLALANVLGSELVLLQKLFDDGKHSEARALQHRLIGPNLCVTKRYGIPGVKTVMDKIGLYGGRCRSPLLSLTEVEIKSLTEEFKANGFL